MGKSGVRTISGRNDGAGWHLGDVWYFREYCVFMDTWVSRLREHSFEGLAFIYLNISMMLNKILIQ